MQYKPKVKAPQPELTHKIQNIMNEYKLTTVCEAAACPNRVECYANNSATFMILGDVCTRACSFCNVKTGHGALVESNEPENLAKAIAALNLQYVVITSVDRDDLKDYGAEHFAACVSAVKKRNPKIKVELLTPDFRFHRPSLEIITESDVYKLAHNQETVRRLSKRVRPQSDYERSLKVLEYYALHSNAVIKSSLMLGLGEYEKDIYETMQDLLDVGVCELTLGQYLQPTPRHQKVEKYYTSEFFEALKQEAYGMGFKAVASGILVRSSYFAQIL